jgi:hypothetical protein
LRFVGRSVSSRWLCALFPSPFPLAQLQHDLTMAQGGMLAAITPGTMRGITSITIAIIIGR